MAGLIGIYAYGDFHYCLENEDGNKYGGYISIASLYKNKDYPISEIRDDWGFFKLAPYSIIKWGDD